MHRKGCVHRRRGYQLKNHSTSLEGDDINAKVVLDNAEYGIPDRTSTFLKHKSEVNMKGARKRSDNGQRRQYRVVRRGAMPKNIKQMAKRVERHPKIKRKELSRFARHQAYTTQQKVSIKDFNTNATTTSRDVAMTNLNTQEAL